MPSKPPAPAANRLLAALPRKDRERFMMACERVDLQYAGVLAEAGEISHHAYFPTGALISLIAPIDGHAALQVGLVGDEGMLGIPLFLGAGASPLRAVVQGSGKALRIGAAAFRREIGSSPALVRLLERYLYVMAAQFAQTAVCTRFHVVQARLARWLLMMHDRAYSDALHITQEFLAYMLGVRRVGVTRAASALKQRGLIGYHRGDITILDRAGLEAAACDCYAADKLLYARALADQP